RKVTSTPDAARRPPKYPPTPPLPTIAIRMARILYTFSKQNRHEDTKVTKTFQQLDLLRGLRAFVAIFCGRRQYSSDKDNTMTIKWMALSFGVAVSIAVVSLE